MIHAKKRIALVHDYLNEFGGAERVLKVFSEMYSDAPIYTIYKKDGSAAAKEFDDRKIVESWFAKLPYSHRLISPLRFLLPAIWNSFDFSDYDLVITSAAWAVTKGMKKGPSASRSTLRTESSGSDSKSSGSSKSIEICYLHTPPRWLYGYDESRSWSNKWYGWMVKSYALIVGHFLRQYDFKQAQKPDLLIVNSENVGKRVEKFYRRYDYKVIYPPVDVSSIKYQVSSTRKDQRYNQDTGYYLAGGRMSASKNFDLIIKACKKANVKLKIYGTGVLEGDLKKLADKNASLRKQVEFLGRISDDELVRYYAGAKAFIAAQKDEDFGITLVEAAAAGTPTIAYRGGGLVESVVEGKTGIFFDDLSVDSLVSAIKKFEKKKWDQKVIQEHAEKFSRERFVEKIAKIIAKTN